MPRERLLRAVLLLALPCALLGASQVPFGGLLDPVANLALPPFVDRVPELGDRWTYNAPAPSWSELTEVEVTALEPWGEGWRYRVETRSIAMGVAESEWFILPDGQVLQGDQWTDGVLSFDVAEPSVVVERTLRPGRRGKLRRDGVWEWAGTTLGLPIRHRGRIRASDVEASELWPSPALEVDVAWRSSSYCRVPWGLGLWTLAEASRREELKGWYDPQLGLVAWVRATVKGCATEPHERVLVSADVGGIVVP
jgi:hypothetical protein